ncbi:hypothetical protein DYB32_004479 [Aphanomyces invadans]|uniref:GH16 domain-containing protein n=1 Tax=Aphanomyces invadans TaxID=157072 RepID=A0A3R7D169_9STRA|nr:hypothetical protein DYB32_004479 [Aphanomyces invadans]
MVTALTPKEEYLIFEDDFDSGFDLSVWKHDITLGGNGNREFEVYVNSRNNSYVKDGKLHLRATLTDEAYGRDSIEGGVMDLWGNGPDYKDDKGDPIGNNRFSACFHFGPAWNKDGYPVAVNDTKALPNHRSYGDEFHTFGFYWDEDEMYAYVDKPENVVTRVADYGKKSFWDIGLESGAWNASDSYNNFQEGPINAPFDQEMYLIMNVAVGGTSIAKGFLDSGYFPDGQGNKPWHTNDSFPAANFYHQKDKWFPSWTTNEDMTTTTSGRSSDFSAMQIDSVKVWGIHTTTATTTMDCSATCPHASSVPTCLEPSTSTCFATTSACFPGTTPCALPAERLVFHDSFDEDRLDLTKWQHEITMTGDRTSFMHMSTEDPTNSHVKNGRLVIKPTLSAPVVGFLDNSTVDLWGTSPANQCTSNYNFGCLQTGNAEKILPPIRSAMLRTEKSFSFRYGRVEVRAKIPTGQWLRPVFRLLPKFDSYGEWPQSGEIVLFEAPAATNVGSEQSDDRDAFHVYGLFWDESDLYMYVDSRDNIVSRVEGYGTTSLWKSQWGDNESSPYREQRVQAPFDQHFYLSLGLRVGGNDGFFPDNIGNKPWNDTSTRHKESTCQIDRASFDKALNEWSPTWNAKADSSSLEIDQVSVWATSTASSWTYHGAFDREPEPEAEKLLFSDSFATLDMRRWKPEITMNTGGEFQMYVNHRQVGFVRNKTLLLRPALSSDIIGNWSLFQGYIDMWGTDLPSKCTAAAASGCGHLNTPQDMAPPIHSASFRTAESFSFRYGHVQITATLPAHADYLLPRLRLIPLTSGHAWLDIAVTRTLPQHHKTTQTVATGYCTNATSCDVAYHEIEPHSTHVYGVIWDATDVVVYLDTPSHVVWHRPTPPSMHEDMFLVAQVGVGGISSLPHYAFGTFNNQDPSAALPVPWNASAPYPHTQFYRAKDQWHTVGDHSALQVHAVHVWSVRGTKWRAHRVVGDPDVAASLVQVKSPTAKHEKVVAFTAAYTGTIPLPGGSTAWRRSIGVLTADKLDHSLVDKLKASLAGLFPGSHHTLYGPVVRGGNVITATVQFDPTPSTAIKENTAARGEFKLEETQALVQLHSQGPDSTVDISSPRRTWLWVVGGGLVLAGVLLFAVSVGTKILRRRMYTSIPERVL